MAYNDLREFIRDLEQRGLLKRIQTEVDCDLEITEITDRVSKMTGEKNVALLFENVKGHTMPVLMNAFGSMERMALALGAEKLDDIAEDIAEIFRLPHISLQNKLDLLKLIPKAKSAINFPKYVKTVRAKKLLLRMRRRWRHFLSCNVGRTTPANSLRCRWFLLKTLVMANAM